MTVAMTTLSPRFSEAMTFAAELHREQSRKATPIPYIAHLISAAALVLEAGGDETCAIAALLHDALEDQGRDGATEREIRERFGEPVLAIVKGCTDTEVIPKPPWRERKEAYVAHIRVAPREIRLVSCADKVHNARSIVADLRTQGDALWSRFTGGRDGSLWYYDALSRAFSETDTGPLAAELARVVAEMHALAGR